MKNNNQNTKFNIGLYKVKETKTLNFPYGKITLHKDDVMILPHSLPIQKKHMNRIENIFKTEIKPTDNLFNKRILINRYGGIGDLLCILPAIYELKRQNPNCQFGMMSAYSYLPLFYNFPKLIEGCVNNIVLYNSIKHFDYYINLDKLVEDPKNYDKNIHDIFAEKLNVIVNNNSINKVIDGNKINQKDFPRNGIGIQYKTNSLIRNYPIENIIKLINLIKEKYPNELIHLLGAPDDYINVNYIQAKTNGNVLVNGCDSSNKMNINESFDLISTLKLVISSDSSALHMAGLTNTPMIGLYGPFKGENRIKYYNNSVGINSKMECGPCNRHQPFNWCKWTGSYGKCLDNISPELIVSVVEDILG